jgi:hypothetical protein
MKYANCTEAIQRSFAKVTFADVPSYSYIALAIIWIS